MTEPEPTPWQGLLSPDGFSSTEPRHFRLVRRSGEPFLLLPFQSKAARRGLDLYPAQTRKARLLRGVLSSLLSVGLAPGAQPASVEVAPDSPLVRFLCAGQRWADLQLAMLLGNPRAPGRRFVALIMDAQGTPLHIVKAGMNEQAVMLIQQEAAFLKSHSSERLHSPQLRGVLSDKTISAISLCYAAGQPPRAGSDTVLREILGGWLNSGTQLHFSTLPHAQQLLASTGLAAAERRLLARLDSRPIASAIHHGDFAPWNIRAAAASGRWTVLDWERGEPQGPPAWDWFHFRVQPAVLVERLQPEAVLARLESAIEQPIFQAYAKAACIEGLERELLLAYLLHAREVIRQTEGTETIRAMANLLASRLKPD